MTTLYTISSATPASLTTEQPRLTLSSEQMVAPLLCPLPDGDAVLLGDWTDDHAQPFRVPAALVSAVRLALGLSGVTA